MYTYLCSSMESLVSLGRIGSAYHIETLLPLLTTFHYWVLRYYYVGTMFLCTIRELLHQRRKEQLMRLTLVELKFLGDPMYITVA